MTSSRAGASIILVIAAAAGPLRAQAASGRAGCAADNLGLTLPAGFCAGIAADSIRGVRHLVAMPNGDLYVAVVGNAGGVLALHDGNGDGVYEEQKRFGPGQGGGIALAGNVLYFATNTAIVKWTLTPGTLVPAGAPDTIVSGLAAGRQHNIKTIAVGKDGSLYVNIGVPSNSCQEKDREPASKGIDPCPHLDSAGGIWRFDTRKSRQTQKDGERFATGLRNVVALTMDPAGTALYGVQHGRDNLFQNWPSLYNEQRSAENPAEELFLLTRGGNYGWPYCYYDFDLRQKTLAPEYGGDGKTAGRCASMQKPLVAFPGHWAPDGIAFYTGTQFPASYRGGAFVAFHGSWNRAPLPQAGYNVAFVPFTGGRAAGTYTVFADGFRGGNTGSTVHRPTGLVVAPDGSLLLTDDTLGRIYRIRYTR